MCTFCGEEKPVIPAPLPVGSQGPPQTSDYLPARGQPSGPGLVTLVRGQSTGSVCSRAGAHLRAPSSCCCPSDCWTDHSMACGNGLHRPGQYQKTAGPARCPGNPRVHNFNEHWLFTMFRELRRALGSHRRRSSGPRLEMPKPGEGTGQARGHFNTTRHVPRMLYPGNLGGPLFPNTAKNQRGHFGLILDPRIHVTHWTAASF